MKSRVEVRVSKNFKKEAKRFLRKFPSLGQELKNLQYELTVAPEYGTPLGGNCYKIRLAVRSKGKGKSGGMRVITFLEMEIIGLVEKDKEKTTTVNLISIYDKSEIATLTMKEIKALISEMKSAE